MPGAPRSTQLLAPALLVAVLGIGAAFAGCRDADKPPTKSAATPAVRKRRPAVRAHRVPPPLPRRRHTRGAIFTVCTNGTGEEQLIQPESGELDDMPDWSPDGRAIAFQRPR